MTTLTKVDQTIFATDPKRLGNCFAACVATALGIDLEQVPHFVEMGAHFGDVAVMGDPDACKGQVWWGMFLGFVAGHGKWPVMVDKITDAERGELVFVHGQSPRGVTHQVLYREGRLWHDPHPSRAGLIPATDGEFWVLRPLTRFNHLPTEECP